MNTNTHMSADAKLAVAASLEQVLGATFTLYFRVHSFRNVEGPMFFALHAAFDEDYTDLWNSIDEYAERIRALGAKAPGSPMRLVTTSELGESEPASDAAAMVREMAAGRPRPKAQRRRSGSRACRRADRAGAPAPRATPNRAARSASARAASSARRSRLARLGEERIGPRVPGPGGAFRHLDHLRPIDRRHRIVRGLAPKEVCGLQIGALDRALWRMELGSDFIPPPGKSILTPAT
jgi:starvation-inducible DNA-binding protein